MRKQILLIVLIFVIGICFNCEAQLQVNYTDQWPQFRGPRGIGYIGNAQTPATWNIENGEHIKWKTDIPGLAHSCPVVWDNRIFISTAVNMAGEASLKVGLYGDIDEADDNQIHEFRVYCLDKNSGKIIWEKVSHRGIPKSKRHTKATQANCTPATDGKYLVVHFGSEGLYCYDLEGNLKWKKDMGILNPGPYTDPGVEWGYASSPIIYRDKIFVQCDIPQHPYLAALEISTGNEIWRASREGEVSTWCTPAICETGGKIQVVTNGYRKMGGYDAETGKEIWSLSNGGDAPAPMPVVALGHIFLNSAHGRYGPIFVVSPDAKGDITLAADSTRNEFIRWSIKRGGAYMQSPLIYGDYLYNLQVNGGLTCYHAMTGEVKYKENLADAFSASGVAADGKVYFASETGMVYVIEAGPSFKLLSKNRVGDICMATPAISGNTIYFRTQHQLVAVE